ncbi:MAG: RNA polymerase sigma factor [Planctomycetota bacterium]
MNRNQQNRELRRWLSQHRGLLLKVVRSFATARSDQDDLFQEIAIRLWESIPNHRDGIAETTWTYRVALYAAINWSKKEKRIRHRNQTLDGAEHLLIRPEEPPDPRLDWLYEQISRLDEIDRSLTLLLLDGLSYREMSETLGISVSNVGVKINRIKKHLSGISANDPSTAGKR